jgi:hypothetical protein
MWNLFMVSYLIFLRLNNLFIGSKQTLEALEISEKSYFNILVKFGSNHSTNQNRFRPDLRSYIAELFWYSRRLS